MEQSIDNIVERFLKLASRGMPDGMCETSGKAPKFCVEACIFMATHPEITDKDVNLAEGYGTDKDLENYEGPGIDGLISDRPDCVNKDLRELKIDLNDSVRWKSNKERAKYLIRVGIAQIGSRATFQKNGFNEPFENYLDEMNILHGSYTHGHSAARLFIFHLENFLVKKKVKGALWLRRNGWRYKDIPRRETLFKGLKE